MTETTPYLEIHEGSSGPATTACPARIGLADGRLLDAELFLLSDPMRPGGVVSVEATLDGEREFIPVRFGARSALLRRDAVRTVELAPDAPGTDGFAELSGSLDVVNLHFDSGDAVSGVLLFPAPAEAMRMSDVFNRPGRFLTLSTGETLLLVAKAHLVEVSF